MGIGVIGSLRASLILLLIWGFVEGAQVHPICISSGAWLIITDEEIRGRAMVLRGTIAQALRPLGI